MSEDILFSVTLVGLALGLVGWLWLTARAFGQSKVWGALVLLFPPAGLAFAALHSRPARAPLGLLLVGLVLAGAPIAANRLLPVDLGPRDALVEGERHLTLTGWDRKDYGLLRERRDTVVLQMANPDVTDETLRLLAGMDRLKELDLANTAITDAGLAALAALPALERLRLAGTTIGDPGFDAHLAPKASLRQLDLRGTGVSAERVAQWRQAAPGRRAMR